MFAILATMLATCVLAAAVQPQGDDSAVYAKLARHQLSHTCPAGSDPDVLLTIAEGCAWDLHSNKGCRAVGPRHDYAIIKDKSPRKPQGYLLIPVQCVTGIEDHQVLQQPVVEFWKAAWSWARKELPAVPASHIGVAVNSLGRRGNDQLHFHLSCIDRGVIERLKRNEARIPEYSSTVQPLRIPLGPRHNLYAVVKVKGLEGNNSPFRVVDQMHGGELARMAGQGIAIIAARGRGQYYLLNTTEEDGRGGHAEELLDQRCR